MFRKLFGKDKNEDISTEQVKEFKVGEVKERTFILETDFKKYSDKEINALLFEEIINSSFDTWGWMVLEPDKQIDGSNFIQVSTIVAEETETGYLWTQEINFGETETGYRLYRLTTEDKNVIVQNMVAYWQDQVIPDISLWEDVSDILQQF